jgi:hypothetical protein
MLSLVMNNLCGLIDLAYALFFVVHYFTGWDQVVGLLPRGFKHEWPVRPRNMIGGFSPIDFPAYASSR